MTRVEREALIKKHLDEADMQQSMGNDNTANFHIKTVAELRRLSNGLETLCNPEKRFAGHSNYWTIEDFRVELRERSGYARNLLEDSQ